MGHSPALVSHLEIKGHPGSTLLTQAVQLGRDRLSATTSKFCLWGRSVLFSVFEELRQINPQNEWIKNSSGMEATVGLVWASFWPSEYQGSHQHHDSLLSEMQAGEAFKGHKLLLYRTLLSPLLNTLLLPVQICSCAQIQCPGLSPATLWLMLAYQLSAPAARLASRLHSPASLVWAISLSTSLRFDFQPQTELLLLLKTVTKHTGKRTRIHMDDLKASFLCFANVWWSQIFLYL